MKRWLLIVWLLPVAVWGQKLGNADFLNLFKAIDASELHVYTDELDGYFSDIESQWKVGEGVSLFAGRRIRMSQCEQLRGWVDAVENDDLPTYAIGQFALGKSYRGLLIRTYGEYWASSIRLLVWDNFGERVTQMIELADQKVDEGEESFKEGWLIKEDGKQYVVIAGTAYGFDMKRYEAELRSQTLEGEVPEVVLASEKRGHYIFIRRLANEAGVSFVCMNGEPAVLSLEYFSDDLKNALEPAQEGTTQVEDDTAGAVRRRKTRIKRDSENSVFRKPLTVLCISDVDPAGYSIENSLVSGLRRNGHQVEKVVKLVDANAWSDEEIEIVRYPAVSYELKEDGTIVPVAPATMSQVTKGRQWWESIGSDPRLIGEKVTGGKKIVTIYGIESDAAEREDIKDRFYGALK